MPTRKKRERIATECSVCRAGGRIIKGLCTKHYHRLMRHGDPNKGRAFYSKITPTSACSAGGCINPVIARGLCGKHYARVRSHGDINGGKFHHSEKRREWHPTPDGYVWRYDPNTRHAMPNGHVFQHRFVVGEIINRPLLPSESVHHKNGVRSDNAPANLELWTRGQPPGQRVQDLVGWAKEILRLYPDEVLSVLERNDSRGAGS